MLTPTDTVVERYQQGGPEGLLDSETGRERSQGRETSYRDNLGNDGVSANNEAIGNAGMPPLHA